MSIDVDVVPACTFGDDRPYPVARLWIDGELFDTYPAGMPRQRVTWLPAWIPFNRRWDFGFYAQLASVERLKEFGRTHYPDLRSFLVLYNRPHEETASES